MSWYFYVQWVPVGWKMIVCFVDIYWWNCWPSLFFSPIYQQNKQSSFIPLGLIGHKNTTTYNVGNPVHGLKQVK
jgi:hypothetical protein